MVNVNIPEDADGRKLYRRMLDLYEQELEVRANYENRKWAEHDLNVRKEDRMAAKANGGK